MPIKTHDTYINELIAVHGNRYDLSETVYKNQITKITLICNKHGKFEKWPKDVLRGGGCSQCALENKTKTHEEFVIQANKVHNNKYTYPYPYNGSSKPLIICCPVHGEVRIGKASDHVNRGCGCRHCGHIIASEQQYVPLDKVLSIAVEKHGNKYDYTNVINNYKGVAAKYEIICPIHGSFVNSSLASHLGIHNGNADGCKKCANEEKTLSHDEFIYRSNLKHNNKYTYNDPYIGSNKKINIICPIHGQFKQLPIAHMPGMGCKKCGEERQIGSFNKSRFINHPEVINKPAFLYFFKITVDDKEYLKVGITTRTAKHRLRNLTKNGVTGEIFNTYQGLLINVYNLEQHLLTRFKHYIKYPKNLPTGKTECFDVEKTAEIMQYLNDCTLLTELMIEREIEYVNEIA